MPDSTPLVDRHPVRLSECRHGPMAYLVTDRYIGRSLDLYGEFSEAEVEILVQLVREGDTVLDVGANVGSMTVPLARAVGPHGVIHAFEPQAFVFQLLNCNTALNVLTQVVTHRLAVGRSSGEVLVPRLDPLRTENFGGLSLEGRSTGDTVRLVSVDELELDACHLIKVDVEGMENEVLGGARATIDRFRPHLYVENDRADRSAILVEHLLGLGYRLFWHAPPLFNPANFRGTTDNVFADLVSLNMLAIHRSRPSVVQGLDEISSADAAADVVRRATLGVESGEP